MEWGWKQIGGGEGERLKGGKGFFFFWGEEINYQNGRQCFVGHSELVTNKENTCEIRHFKTSRSL